MRYGAYTEAITQSIHNLNDDINSISLSTVFKHNDGDYYKVSYSIDPEVEILPGDLTFASLVGAKGDKGDPGDSGIAAIHSYGNIVATSGTSGVDITTTPNLSATYLTLNGNLTPGVPLGTIEYDSITDRFWITTNT